MKRRHFLIHMSGAGIATVLTVLGLALTTLAPAAASTDSRRPAGGPQPAGAPVNVQVTRGHVDSGEPAVPLVVDPTDPDRLMTVAQFHRYSPRCLAAVTSADAGASWSRRTCMRWDRSFQPQGAPTVAFGADGSMYIAAIYWSSLHQRQRVEVQRSADDGDTWSTPVPVVDALGPWPEYEFAELRMSADLNPASPRFGTLYVAAVHDDTDYGDLAITVSVSTDGGETWPVSQRIVDGGLNSDPNFAFAPDGTVYVSYAACLLRQGLSCGRVVYLELQRSSDGGRTWAGEQRISVVHARAGSTTYERLARRSPSSFSLSPPIAVDTSNGPHGGRLYETEVTWSPYHLRLRMRHSDDRGMSWSKPVLVAPPAGRHDQFMGSVAVNATGVVGVSWLDRRDDPDNHLYRAYEAFSYDGGRTFVDVAPVATIASNPDPWFLLAEVENVWVGDRLYTAWPDTRSGSYQIEVGWIS